MKRNSGLSMLTAAGVAALATYFFDAQQGRRRRAMLTDKIYGKVTHLDDASRVVAIDLRNRLQGTFGALRQRLTPGDAPDEVLVERVRTRLGRTVSHPRAIQVSADAGTVTLQGPILKREVKAAMRAVWAVRGAHGVIDRLEPHAEAGSVSALQGGSPRTDRIDIAQQHWAPATRFMVGAAGASLAARGISRRSIASPLLLLGGLALLARAATNMDLQQMLGQRGRRSIDLTKTIRIGAPASRIFAFWSNFENFPRFMRNVLEVRRNADDSWHWKVAGPLGAAVEWDARITQLIPNEVIAWSTRPGTAVEHAGIVRFREEADGATRVHVRMSYNPVAGALGHAVASLFGADPAAEMDEDLMRLKVYFETGKPARDAAQPVPAARTEGY